MEKLEFQSGRISPREKAMFTKPKFHQIVTILVALTMLFSAIQPSVASAQSGDGIQRQVNPQSGRVSFIGPESGHMLSASRAWGPSPPTGSRDGIGDSLCTGIRIENPVRDLTGMKSNRSEDGRLTVRYQQNYNRHPSAGR
jgi:hypothetical protein